MDTPDGQRTTERIAAFTERVATLTDDDLATLAAARAAVDETFHGSAVRAAEEVALERSSEYLLARMRVGPSAVPARLVELVELGLDADPDELARWQEIARLGRLALDDALLAQVGAHRLRPPDLRQLLGPWQAMLEDAFERDGPIVR